ncbi:hypothetical protein ABPG75_006250 [Micractinium tetrahymenae]
MEMAACSRLPAAAGAGLQRAAVPSPLTWAHAAGPTGRRRLRQRHRPLAAADATMPSLDSTASAAPGVQQHDVPPISPGELSDLAHDAAAFTAALHRLAAPGSTCTEAHVVAAWTAQQASPALQPRDSPAQQAAALQALVALEELTRRQVVALLPDQLGFVFRCYVLAGGASKPLLASLQKAACSWAGEDYSAAGLAELAWGLASCGQPVSDGCRRLLQTALQDGREGAAAVSMPSRQQQPAQQNRAQQQAQPAQAAPEDRPQAGAAGPPPQQDEVHQMQGRPQRDWQAWFGGTPPSRVSLLLWSAAHLGCRPCESCLEAAAAAALVQGRGLSSLSTKSLLALLWALATLRAEQLQPLLRGVSQQLADRMEACLAGMAQPHGVAAGSGASSSAVAATDPAKSGRRGAGQLTSSQLCTAVWACGQLRHADPAMLAAASALLLNRVEDLGPGDMARVLGGLGQLGYCPAQLLEAIAACLQKPGVLSRFTTRQLAMASFAFASVDFFPGQVCVDAIADACLARRDEFDPRALSHVLWNMSRLGFVDEPFYLAFVPVIMPGIQRYGPAELADIARVYSRYGLNPEWAPPAADTPAAAAAATGSAIHSAAVGASSGDGAVAATTLFDALAAQTVARIQGADVQDVLRIMTAFHEMGLQPEELLAAVEGWADQRLRNLSPQSLSLALWSFARMGSGSPKLLETAAACAEQQLAAFTPGQLAKVAWSLAKLRWPAPRVLRHAGVQLAERSAAFSDKEASNVLWALASEAEALSPEQLDRIAQGLEPRLRGFGPQSLSNIAWAYATLRHKPPAPFLRTLGAAAERQLRAFEPQGLSLLVWSLASLGCRHNRLFSSIVALCRERPGLLRQFEGQNISNLLWGFCRAGFCPDDSFLQDIAEEAELRVCDMKPQELFNIAWAFAQLGHHPRRLFELIAWETAPRTFDFSTQELSNTLWALAKCRHTGPSMLALLHAVERELASREAAFEDRHLTITLWSWGQLSHVPAAAALAPALQGLQRRLPGMDAHALTTLVSGLADMQAARRRRQAAAVAGAGPRRVAARGDAGGEAAGGQTTPAEVWEARHMAGAAARGGAATADAVGTAAEELVSPAVVDALVDRTCQLLPSVQRFQLAQLLRGFAELGSEAGANRFLRSPSPAAEALLADAAKRDHLPSLVELLWAMAAWRCFPPAAFEPLAWRLGKVPADYRFQQPTLALLGEALAAMEPQQRQQLRLRRGLLLAAGATARAAAAAAALGPAGAAGSGNGDSEGSDDERVQQPAARRQRQLAMAEGGPPPACSNTNEELPVGSSLDEELA